MIKLKSLYSNDGTLASNDANCGTYWYLLRADSAPHVAVYLHIAVLSRLDGFRHPTRTA